MRQRLLVREKEAFFYGKSGLTSLSQLQKEFFATRSEKESFDLIMYNW